MLDMKSQQRHGEENTAKKTAEKDAATKTNEKKMMKIRKEDMSQLADQLFGSSL